MEIAIATAAPLAFAVLWTIILRTILQGKKFQEQMISPRRRLYAGDEIRFYLLYFVASAVVSTLIVVAYAPHVVSGLMNSANADFNRLVSEMGPFLPTFLVVFGLMLLTSSIMDRLIGGIVDKFLDALRNPEQSGA